MSSLSDPVLILIIGSVSGLLGMLFKLSYSSKCTRIKCCCLTVERDVANEAVININNTSNRNLSTV